jgi:hypothetical protein
MILRLTVLMAGAALLLTACGPTPFRQRVKPEPEREVSMAAKETAQLTDREYLMRKATIGTRPERLEALDVIERADDPTFVPFLLKRLEKEDDRFIQIRIMDVLAAYGDVRAIPPLRSFARWDQTRVGVEAIVCLYELGDDSFIPKLVRKLRVDEDNPELAGIAYRALRKLTGADLPPTQRAWMNYYRTRRLAPYQTRVWFWPFHEPLPPTAEGTTKVVRPPKGKIPLPERDVRTRNTIVSWYDWWKPDEP